MTGQILEALAAAGQPMRLTALANHLGEPKARMHRHLSTLKYLGFVEQDAETEFYKLGLKLAHVGQAAMEQFDLRRLAEPYAMKLRDLTGQTIVLSIPASGDAIVSAAWEFPNPVMISVNLGFRLPAHASAQGRLTLAFAPPELQSRVLSRKLPALTPRTITDPAKLRDRLAAVREQLYEVASMKRCSASRPSPPRSSTSRTSWSASSRWSARRSTCTTRSSRSNFSICAAAQRRSRSS